MPKKIKPSPFPVYNPNARPKKQLPLHYHPNAIKKNIDSLIEVAEDESLKFLFEDIKTLVGWALDKLPIAIPKGEEKAYKDAENEQEKENIS